MEINGYKIIYIPTKKNITSVHAYIKTGSAFETEKQSGIAHLLEHVITDSWNKCKGNCTQFWSKKGIISNAQTTSIYTRYYIVGLTKEIENMIDYIASIITNAYFDTKCIERSKEAVKDELLIRTNVPNWKLHDTFFKLLEDNTKYNGYGRISDYSLKIKNLDTIKKEDIVDYYEKWYRSNNMFFVVVSNKSINVVTSYLAKYLHKRPMLSFKSINMTLKYINHSSVIYRKDAEKSSFIIGFICNKLNSQDYLYYNLIQDMLTGDISSLLYRILRDKMNLIYNIKLYYEMDKSYILSTFEVNCQFKNEKKLITNFIDTLKKFMSGNFDDKLIKRSKERLMIMDMNNSRDNTEYLNLFYANQYMMSGKFDMTPDDYIKFVNGITKENLLSVSKRIFQFSNMIIACETKN